MNSHIFSFVECGHRVSKQWDNSELRFTYKSVAVISENNNKMLQLQNIALN